MGGKKVEDSNRHHDFRTATNDEAFLIEDSPGEGINLLDELKAALGKPVQKEPLKLKVPKRPEISLVFDPTFEFEQYQAWVKRVTPKKNENPDMLRLALIVLSHTSQALVFKGRHLGYKLSSSEVHEMLGVPIGSTAIAIRKMFGSDGHVIQVMQKIIIAAGYSVNGDVEETDENDPLELL